MISRSGMLLAENWPPGGRRSDCPCAPGALGLTLAASNRGLFAAGAWAHTLAPINTRAITPTGCFEPMTKNFTLQTRISQGTSPVRTNPITLYRARRGLLSRGFPKQQRRSNKQHEEHGIPSESAQNSRCPGRHLRIPNNQQDRQNQRLSERCHEQGARHAVGSEPRHGGTDDPHNRHGEIHHGGGIHVIGGLDEVSPDEDERRHKRNADGSSVHRRAYLPDDHLKRQTDAEEESGHTADKKKHVDIPVPSTDKQAASQGYRQQERRQECRALPDARALSAAAVCVCIHGSAQDSTHALNPAWDAPRDRRPTLQPVRASIRASGPSAPGAP